MTSERWSAAFKVKYSQTSFFTKKNGSQRVHKTQVYTKSHDLHVKVSRQKLSHIGMSDFSLQSTCTRKLAQAL